MKDLIPGLFVVFAFLGSGLLAGCNTMEGAGKDVERAGEKIQSSNCTKEDSATDPNCRQ